MNKPPVSISLSSYGADLVRQQGQGCFTTLLAAAGASRIEWREELLTHEQPAELAASAQAQGLQSIFSSPLELWLAEGAQPNSALPLTLQRAEAFGSKWLKVSLGHFTDAHDLTALADMLAASPVQLLVENDQTMQGGRLEPLQRFFAATEQQGLPIGMTFDIGNWQWQDQSATLAARLLGPHVRYVHCKAVARRDDGKLIAVPPALTDLHLWEQLFKQMPAGVMRAAEYPLQGEDLLQLTATHVTTLAGLGQIRREPVHV
ncbi:MULTISPECIES: sugar phosphate isomerase/epimerase [unclassified Pseudomonas]|uniref:sugar phosphate isomerase/epimerase family protein n=1 Tax=unclassified Pseudomonas TaxID=196821 RepID=UPI00053867ED|nr:MULTISPECIES: TIM barrel protein [unclassified Pseudomonas]MBD0687760.1 AP endonuclease [Pseudomonas sp. PSB18]CDF97527.1 Epimerase KguE [Pseudomonas sp. SHC52]